MNGDMLTVLQDARCLRKNGRYREAVNLLQDARRKFGRHVELATELGETLFIQGYFTLATKSLEEDLVYFDKSNDLYAAAGNIIYCFASFYATGQFKESLRRVEKIYRRYLSSTESGVINDATVLIEAYYCKIWKLAHTCGGVNHSHMLSEALPRIKDTFDVVLKRHDFCNALKLARVYRNCSNVPDSNMLVEALATDESTPALCRAEAQALIAQRLESLEKREEQDRLYAKALQCFEDEGHCHGSLDIKIAKLCRYPLDPKEDQLEEKITGLLKEYEALDYPAGLGSAYLELLGLAQVLHNFEVQTVSLNELERLFIASGSRLTWFMIRNSALSRWVLTGADRGKVITGATALWNELAQSDCSVLRGQAAQTVSHAYYALKDPEMTAEWSRKAQQDWPETSLTAIPSLARGFDPRKIDQLAQFYERTIQLVEHDITRQSPEDAVEKLAVFLNQALTTRNQTDESIDVIKRALTLMEEYIPSLSDPSMVIRQRAHLRQSQGSLLVMKSTRHAEIDLELAALQAYNEAKDLYLKDNLIGQAAIVLQHQALVHLSIFQKFERRNDPETHQALENALKLFRITLDSVKSLGLVALSWENSYWVAHCQYRQWRRGSCPAETLSDSLRSAERFVDQQRQEVSILPGIEAVHTKRRLSSDEHVRNIYRFAIDVFHRRDDWQEAWRWVQKSKARSLSDLLGLGALVPQSLIDQIQEQKSTRDLYEVERKLFERLSAASNMDRFPIRIQLEHHQNTMKEHHHLKELLNMREGVPVPLEELRVASSPQGRSNHGRGIVFVDWFIAQFDISVVVVKSDGEIAIRTLPITAEDIQDWVSKYLNGGNGPGSFEDDGNALSGLKEDDEADEGPLRQLDILVAPLNDLSSSNDLLVLCPTGILHSIPLHALRVGSEREREILITRNPIVYCASLTSFAQCCRRASPNTPRRNSFRKSFLAVYEPWPDNPRGHGAFNYEEQHEVYSSVKSLSQGLKGDSFSGHTVTSDIVRHCLELSHLIHFHGHCDFEKEIIAEQSLQISGGPSTIAPFSVKDLFSLRIQACHISLLACGSATQHFEAGDEPLGLVTAFLSAGASSVLGTLWPVESSTARKFSERFYAHLRASGSDECGVYDLAYAVREAVADVMQLWNLRHPYHWASFVLHGSWFWNGDSSFF